MANQPSANQAGACSRQSSALELSIIIVNWKSADYVLACLATIHAQTTSLGYEVIVIDNATFDGCGERLAREWPSTVFIQSPTNIGFARANNLAAEQARGRILLFLNPDTEVLDGAINQLHQGLQALPDAGIVGCRLLNTDGSLQTSCVQAFPTVVNQMLDAELLQSWFPKSAMWGMAALFQEQKIGIEVEVISGACMMVRRDVFERVGGFSSDYFMYAEDLDLCFKTRQSGFKNYLLPEATIVHHGGGSSKKSTSDFSSVMVRESVGRFLRKFHGPFYSRFYRFALSGTAVVRLLILAILLPLWLARRQGGRWSNSCRKWFAILRWSLGLTRWLERYG